MAPSTTLGYAEPLDDHFGSEQFPSKIGGKPKWLDPTHPLSVDRVLCDECGKPMVMLLQLYAPEDEPKDAFHRMLYVFICRNGKCHRSCASRCMRVFRSQIPENNGLYKSDEIVAADICSSGSVCSGNSDSNEKDGDIEWVLADHVKSAPLCVVCGLLGNKACSKCHLRHYCSRDHQITDWDSGHRTQCKSSGKQNAESAEHRRKLQRMLYPEQIIVSEEESGDAEDDNNDDGSDDDTEDNEGVKPEDMALVPVTNERVEDSEVDVDRAFLAFQNRISENPDQIIRYARSPNTNEIGEPLYVSDADKPVAGFGIPDCEHCGAVREFELQIMPQMLNHLSIDSVDPFSIDWGTLLIYSCPSNCSKSSNSTTSSAETSNSTCQNKVESSLYLSEVICRQNFSSHGIGEKYVRAMHGDNSGFEKQFDSLNI
ncbi:hypothetical protein GGI25_005608 [Coemansia spiralis]|uniref:MYND-type domain-containing protein n=2 Tax=Coemansia TaxID=4863 RepID=A0A9W8G487_9FUNG|nr:programmed cell death protein 2 [Coemansia spiralis]KAJ1989473.1 hypothetical protein EDC05_004659 [Coemansia umbellata]KAJ2620168.1 hypothetical protein GGI26_005233 [Coemansia sp. RSA 1358]KAJ2671122.1 hypothetical protein GGI25_005608 [Coemansia spiralis]